MRRFCTLSVMEQINALNMDDHDGHDEDKAAPLQLLSCTSCSSMFDVLLSGDGERDRNKRSRQGGARQICIFARERKSPQTMAGTSDTQRKGGSDRTCRACRAGSPQCRKASQVRFCLVTRDPRHHHWPWLSICWRHERDKLKPSPLEAFGLGFIKHGSIFHNCRRPHTE